MKVTLYMAISIDGLITRGTEDSSWVSKTDWQEFYKYINENDAVIMGRRTMEQFSDAEFPIPGKVNIVLSRNQDLHKDGDTLIVMQGTPDDVVKTAQSKGLTKLLVIGGENVNSQFLRSCLIDEIVLSVHPLIIGSGKSLFGKDALDTKLELIGSNIINNELVQLRYKVLR